MSHEASSLVGVFGTILLATACGGSSTPVDAGGDLGRLVDGAAGDGLMADLADLGVADQPMADAKSNVDAKVADASSADGTSPSPYSDLEWISSTYAGGFNPHTLKSTLKTHKLTMNLTTLAGTNPKSCTATLGDPAMSALLAAAGKVAWLGVKSSYTPGKGCAYPGDSGEITVTLHRRGGPAQTVASKWCEPGGTPTGLPKDFAAFIQAQRQAQKAACPGI